MAYYLTDSQKDLISWFVQQVLSKDLTEEFNVAWGPSDEGYLNKHDYKGVPSSIPVITRIALDALEEEGLLRCVRNFRKGHEANRKCSLTSKASMAVASNFKEQISASPLSINFENITNSQIQLQQDSPGATQIATFTLNQNDKAELANFVEDLESLVNQLLELQLEAKDDLGKLKLHINTIRLHLESDYSDPIIIGESLRTTKSLLEGILSSAIVTAVLSPEVHRLANHLLGQVSLYLSG